MWWCLPEDWSSCSGILTPRCCTRKTGWGDHQHTAQPISSSKAAFQHQKCSNFSDVTTVTMFDLILTIRRGPHCRKDITSVYYLLIKRFALHVHFWVLLYQCIDLVSRCIRSLHMTVSKPWPKLVCLSPDLLSRGDPQSHLERPGSRATERWRLRTTSLEPRSWRWRRRRRERMRVRSCYRVDGMPAVKDWIGNKLPSFIL